MEVITDGLLITGTLFAGIYCWVLSGRVRALKSLESGLGGAIVTLTRQIELARATLDEARKASSDSGKDLEDLVSRAEAASRQLRLLMAAANKEPVRREARRPETEAAAPSDPAPAETRIAVRTGPSAPEGSGDPSWSAASLEIFATRKRPQLGPRLVPARVQEPQSDHIPARLEDAGPPDLPKPRKMSPLDTVLRRRGAAEKPALGSEADLMAALTALAAGAER